MSKSNGEREIFHFINLKHGKHDQTWLDEFITFDNYKVCHFPFSLKFLKLENMQNDALKLL